MKILFFLGASGLELSLFGLLKFLLEFLLEFSGVNNDYVYLMRHKSEFFKKFK
jgi:hypothetical protein